MSAAFLIFLNTFFARVLKSSSPFVGGELGHSIRTGRGAKRKSDNAKHLVTRALCQTDLAHLA